MLSIAKTELENEFIEKIETVIGPAGFRVVDLDLRIARNSLLRIFIEKVSGESAVTLADCSQLSRELDTFLESSAVFPGPFELEVSSPGLDRRLRLEGDFNKSLGKKIKLKLKEKIETGGKNLTGTLTEIENGDIHLEWNNRKVKVSLANILQANINY